MSHLFVFLVVGISVFLKSGNLKEISVPQTILPETYLVTPTPRPQEATKTVQILSSESDDMFNLIQIWREDNGYKPFTKSNNLCRIAKERANEVASNWSHDGVYKYWSSKIEECPNGCQFAENMVKGFSSSRESLEGWLKSPEHLKNLSGDFKYSCVGNYGSIYVQEFLNN